MEDIDSILKRIWGYDAFRTPQKEIILSVLEKKDTIALLPTGGGKSLCFQLPALTFQGKTIVISPLIALMKDQVDNLFSKGIIAKSLNSNLHYNEIDAILERFVYGDLKILYISPERLKSELFMTRISKVNLSLIAVDEAHCISQWGYDFRPSYFDIPLLKGIFPKVPIIALTATATDKVIADIDDKLQLKNTQIFKKSFARNNLSLTVIQSENKRNEVLQILTKIKGCIIIYVRNRKETIETGIWLSQHGYSCVSYHGGMEKGQREKNQQAWMKNQVRIMVSTNAFGMGIDKSDVRLVIHLDIAPSLEEYYQEAGRAGRDGKESYGITIIDQGDIETSKISFNDQFPSLEIITSVYDRLCRYYKVAYGSGMMESYDFHISEVADYMALPIKKVYHILNILEKEGWMTFSDAFKEPSKIMLLANQEDMEFMQRTHSIKNNILIHLLRKYEGLFIDFIRIDETRIAKELQIEEIQLVHYLNLMQSEGILSYKQRASEPQITFTRERPSAETFEIDKRSYQHRKVMAEKRLVAILNYVQNESTCRQRLIVSYFGEKGNNCGKCDICLGVSESALSSDQLKKVFEHLCSVIQSNPIDIKTYSNIYPFNKRRRIIKAIKDFESEGLIKINNAGFITFTIQ